MKNLIIFISSLALVFYFLQCYAYGSFNPLYFPIESKELMCGFFGVISIVAVIATRISLSEQNKD